MARIGDRIKGMFSGWDSVEYDHNFFGEYKVGDTVKLIKGDHKGRSGKIRAIEERFGDAEYVIDFGNDDVIIVPKSFFSTN